MSTWVIMLNFVKSILTKLRRIEGKDTRWLL
jgi:hypothetical protein